LQKRFATACEDKLLRAHVPNERVVSQVAKSCGGVFAGFGHRVRSNTIFLRDRALGNFCRAGY
jgi:hypothetical protein